MMAWGGKKLTNTKFMEFEEEAQRARVSIERNLNMYWYMWLPILTEQPDLEAQHYSFLFDCRFTYHLHMKLYMDEACKILLLQ